MELLLTAILLGVVVAIIARPLRRGGGRSELRESSELTVIEMAKNAKYREILDAELDFQSGKLSERDYRDIDRELRGEASDLHRRLDAGETKPGRR